NMVGNGIRQAVITRSVAVRGIATALNWLGMSVRAFAPDATEEALDFLEVSSAQRAIALATLAELRAEVAGASVPQALRALGAHQEDIASLFETPIAVLRAGARTGSNRPTHGRT